VPFEFQIKTKWHNQSGTLMETKLCRNGCSAPSGLLAIAIDRNSPVITLQITSEWDSFDAVFYDPHELFTKFGPQNDYSERHSLYHFKVKVFRNWRALTFFNY